MTDTPTPERQQERKPMPLRYRLLVSVPIGLLVFVISAYVGYGQYCDSAVRYDQSLTLHEIDTVVKDIEAYRREKHVLPRTLNGIKWTTGHTDRSGVPVDWWRRPLHYSTDGSHFRIVSYGQDGKPGGTGLDYDLSGDDLPRARAQWSMGSYPSRSDLPAQTTPTFRQFMTYDSHANSGSGRTMFLMSIWAGVVAAVLALRTTGGEVPARGGAWARARRLLLVTVATLFIAIMYVIPLHVPSGH